METYGNNSFKKVGEKWGLTFNHPKNTSLSPGSNNDKKNINANT